MRLPEQPESISSMKERIHKAIEFTVRVPLKLEAGGRYYLPSEHRRHVFDSQDGIRMIVSRDSYSGREFIHVSFSPTEQAAKRLEGAEAFIVECGGLFGQVFPLDVVSGPPDDVRWSGKAVHFFWKR